MGFEHSDVETAPLLQRHPTPIDADLTLWGLNTVMSMPLVQRHPTTTDADLMLRGSNTAVLMPALSVTDLTPRVSLKSGL